MKQKLTLVLAIMLLATSAFSQKKKNKMSSDGKKGTLVGVHFNTADFNAPTGIKSPKSGDVYLRIIEMSKGFFLSYWKGITNKLDFSAKANMMFHDYSAIYKGVPGKNEIGIELEPSVNLRPFRDDALINPFLTVGLGGGLYNKDFGAYLPAGGGVQVNFNSTSYLVVQAQYKWTLTKKVLGDNLFYSLGFLHNIHEKVVPPPPPPPPPPPVVKDRDGDGVLDDDDACPDVPGLASLKGCPDKDGDGIADKDDKCPDVPGLARYQGCPIPDTDKDGINDEQDKCPTVPGVARYQGCPIPDTDKDGVNDEEDKCINEAGPASNFGCPVVPDEIVKKIEAAFKNVFFSTGSAKLLAKSYKPLNEVAKIMSDNPTYFANIDGHTDNTGKPDKNQILSENRAASVKAYLVSKGVGEDRLTATGYGQDKPVAENTTAKGRALNRRVEMSVRTYSK
ncbi:MAG: OmpA family protein [Chitinophagaceae bacterium]|nr:OmpA family protein [Chitinophagaceae bacterium]